jgi:iron complex outermembrane recepter protein
MPVILTTIMMRRNKMSKSLFKIFLVLITGLMFVFSDAVFLLAEETKVTESKADEFTLEEITVTAAKRTENQQKVAIAMDVIADKDLAAEGKTNVDDILSGLANVTINTNSDGMRVSIRGLADYEGKAGNMKTTTPTVAVNIDGAQNDMASAGGNLFDIERVEVLYGPQSTLYSSNSPGGIVNVVTASPKTDRYSANASYGIGNYDVQNFQAAVNVPIISDKLAMRLSGSQTKQGTWVEGSTPSKNKAVRLKTLWTATDKLSFTVTGNLAKATNGGMMGGSVKPFIRQGDATYPDGTALTNPWTTSGSDFGMGANTNAQITQGLNGNASWDSFLGTLTVTPNYSKSSASGWQTAAAGGGPGAPPGGADQGTITSFNKMLYIQQGAEARMASSSDFTLFKWIAGYSIYKYKNNDENTNRVQTLTDGTKGDLDPQLSYTRQTNKAAFANITYPLYFYDKFSLTFGYRQSWDKSEHYDASRSNNLPESMSYNKPDYKWGFEWDLADNMMVYGNYASSYRIDAMGSFGMWDNKTQKFISNLTRPPEENNSYTLGLKSRLFNNSVQLNVAGYLYDYKNAFANDTRLSATMTRDQFIALGLAKGMDETYLNDLWTAGLNNKSGDGAIIQEVGTSGSFNIAEPNFRTWGDMRSYGLDTSIGWVVSSADMVNLSVAYLNSKWSNATFDYMFTNIYTPKSLDGVSSPNSPKWSITASYEHNFDLWDYGMLTPHIDIQHKTHYNLIYNTTQIIDMATGEVDPGYYYQEAYTLYNASLSFQPTSTIWGLSWNVNAAVKNITNYAVKKSYNSMGTVSLMVGEPRTYTAVLSVKF